MADQPKGGIRRCPHCGASDVSLDDRSGRLRCNVCRMVFDDEALTNQDVPTDDLTGEHREAGASNIVKDDGEVLTYRCPSYGAQVVVAANEETSASCHWCRHVFSLEDKIKNGMVPDLVLPFNFARSAAIQKISQAINEKKDELDSAFLNKFKVDAIRGVYFPYFIVDLRAHSSMNGEAEQTIRQHDQGYEIARYQIVRSFDILVDDLTVESSSRRLNQDTLVNSNNIINAIMPFDTENAVAWNANYLRGFTSEKRDVNVDALKGIVALQAGDIARKKACETIAQYDRGVRWDKEHLSIKGTRWKAAYLPVWLYCYIDKTRTKQIYYIAVNGRTGETSWCLPSLEVEKTATFGQARNQHELSTRANIKNIEQTDKLETEIDGISTKQIDGKNDDREIGAMLDGMRSMSSAELVRFQTGHQTQFEGRRAFDKQEEKLLPIHRALLSILVLFLALFLMMLYLTNGFTASPFSHGAGGSYDVDSGFDSSDGGFDSGGDSGGFDYSFD